MRQDLPIDLAAYHRILSSEDEETRTANALAAAKLTVELETRVATKDLHDRSGQDEVAAKSVSEIFGITRGILSEHPRARRAELVGAALLNDLLRPFTSRWHSWIEGGRLNDDDGRRAFRSELRSLQTGVCRFTDLLDAVREGRELVPDDLFMAIDLRPKEGARIRSRRARARIAAGIGEEVSIRNREVIFEAEKREILDRRAASGRGTGDHDLVNAFGLALSGGGIRSATFSLGVVHELIERGIFRQVDYLSTVSGGGYLGTFLSWYLAGSTDPEFVEKQFESKNGVDPEPVRHLRNSSKYLARGGLVPGVWQLLMGVVHNLVALLPFFFALSVITILLRGLGYWGEPGSSTQPFAGWAPTLEVPANLTVLKLAILTLGLQLLGRPVWSFLTRGSAPGTPGRILREALEKVTFLLLWATLALVFLAVVPLLFRWVGALDVVSSSLLPGIAGVVSVVAGRLGSRPWRQKAVIFLVNFLLVLSPVLVGLAIYLGITLIVFALQMPWWALLLASAVILGFLLWFMDLNALSLHPLYRQRLSDCYAAAPGDWPGDGRYRKKRLSEIGGRAAPYHLINAAVNLPSSQEKELRGRKSDFFLFSRHHCGSPTTEFFPTEELERLDPAFDLGTAMSISGAAVSSNMGVKELGRLRFLLTLLNVRLGYWIPNPLHPSPLMRKMLTRGHRCTPGPGFLVKEMLGWMDEESAYLNLSDGGHIENLGVIELLRRRCKFIVAVDAEGDAERIFDGLVRVIRYARIDLGVIIEIDLDPLRLVDGQRSQAHSALGKIVYPGGDIGWLLYLKASLTGNEPTDVLDYARSNTEFPHQSTMDQVYSEDQFESYRALGRHVAAELFDRSILGSRGSEFSAPSRGREMEVGSWFDALALSLLPDNDRVFERDPANLDEMPIGLSISKGPDRTAEEINDATLLVSRRLISLGAKIVSGHDWRREGVLRMMALQTAVREDHAVHVRSEIAGRIISRVPEGENSAPPAGVSKVIDTQTVEKLALRPELTKLSKARICLAGNTNRDVSGILEEAWRAAHDGQPVLVSGCLGGVSGWLADRLSGRMPERELGHDAEEAERRGLPTELDQIVTDIADSIHAHENEEVVRLHRRLWLTTRLDAALIVMLEILDLHLNGSDEVPGGVTS